MGNWSLIFVVADLNPNVYSFKIKQTVGPKKHQTIGKHQIDNCKE